MLATVCAKLMNYLKCAFASSIDTWSVIKIATRVLDHLCPDTKQMEYLVGKNIIIAHT